jgi:HEAT repeat protein
MPLLDPTLVSWLFAAALGLYLLTGGVLIVSRLRYERRERLRRRLASLLAPGPSLEDGRRRALAELRLTPLPLVLELVGDTVEPQSLLPLCAESAATRLGTARVQHMADDAAPHRWWRRVAALRVLALTSSPAMWESLARALTGGTLEVKAVVVTLLGRLDDRRAAAILVQGLVENRYSRSRIAASLEAMSVEIEPLLEPLLDSADGSVRFWAVTLLQRRNPSERTLARLVGLTADADPLVRRAAIEAVHARGSAAAVESLRARLGDAVPYVRAHAARALGALQGAAAGPAVLELLADADWFVRTAAKETLERMGAAVVPAVVPMLTHEDAFARNGAAEVLQNLGEFERLLVAEAEGPSDPARLRVVAELARAGGPAMWDSVLERLGEGARVRAGQLLASLELYDPVAAEGL